MARVEDDALQEPVGVYLAASLREAKQVEALLTTRGVQYAVQVESLGRSTLFGSVRHGAMFYVSAGQGAYCRTLLVESGFRRGILEDEEDPST